MNGLGQRIRRWRLDREMTQGELADECDVSTGAVCQWELDQTSPTQANLTKLCAALRVTHETFYGKLPRAAG